MRFIGGAPQLLPQREAQATLYGKIDMGGGTAINCPKEGDSGYLAGSTAAGGWGLPMPQQPEGLGEP